MEASKRIIQTTRHEYVLRSGTVIGEFNKAVEWALNDMPEDRRRWDDALRIEARDDEIIIHWTEETNV